VFQATPDERGSRNRRHFRNFWSELQWPVSLRCWRHLLLMRLVDTHGGETAKAITALHPRYVGG
jgi:hypothetical protein